MEKKITHKVYFEFEGISFLKDLFAEGFLFLHNLKYFFKFHQATLDPELLF